MKVLIMSDIHGNQQALLAAMDKAAQYSDIEAGILLGDIIDYGMHSNEVIGILRHFPYPLICNIRGNHEDAVIQDNYGRFSSERGKECAKYTRGSLCAESWNYIRHRMTAKGRAEFQYDGKKCLAVHGSLEDEFWLSIGPGQMAVGYEQYDYVFSGHSHQPHFIEKYYACDDEKRRNKKKVVFINPGSVGQPRNLNPVAQFVVLDMRTEQIFFEKAEYDIEKEQKGYHGQVDNFYRERLEWGV